MEWTLYFSGVRGCHSARGDLAPSHFGGQLMKITTIGLDLSKNVFQVHGVDERGLAVLNKKLKRDQVAPFFARLAPCLIGSDESPPVCYTLPSH